MTQNLVILTDLGHDPDDFVAISYLLEQGVNITAILLTPGHLHQVQLANHIRRYYDRNFKIFRMRSDIARTIEQISRVDKKILKNSRGEKSKTKHNGNYDSPENTFNVNGCDFLGLGPYKNCPIKGYNRVVLQGGFCPYNIHMPKNPLDKFIDKSIVGSFNPNGGVKEFQKFADYYGDKCCIVGKNVCHGYTLEKCRHKLFGLAKEYASDLKDTKAMHDLLAAELYLDNTQGIWIKGSPIKYKKGWSTLVNGNNNVLVDIDG